MFKLSSPSARITIEVMGRGPLDSNDREWITHLVATAAIDRRLTETPDPGVAKPQATGDRAA